MITLVISCQIKFLRKQMKISLLLIVLGFVVVVKGQTLEWANHLAGKGISSATSLNPGESSCQDVAIDNGGNVFIVGYFNDSVDFDPGSGVNYQVGSKGEMYLGKYNPFGELVWVKILKGSGGNKTVKIDIDGDDNIVIVGNCGSSVDFDPSNNTSIIQVPPGTANFSFVAKYDNDGNFKWVKTWSGSYFAIFSFDLTLDANNDIFITGQFYEELNFYNITDTTSLQGSKLCAFFVKYNSAGNFQFAHAIDGSGEAQGMGIEVGQFGNIYVIGYFTGEIDFDPGVTVFSLSASGFDYHPNRFFAKYDENGAFIWVRGIDLNSSATNSNYANYVFGLDEQENLILSGNFTNDVDFDLGPGQSLMSSPSKVSTFICKYDSSGNFIWVKGLFGTFVVPTGIVIDCKQEIHLTGCFIFADFDPGPSQFILDASDLNAFMNYFARYSVNGDFISANKIGNNGYGGSVLFSSIKVKDNNEYIAGSFKQKGDFDPGDEEAILMASGVGHNGFFAKYSPSDYTDIGNDTIMCGGTSIVLNASMPNASYLWSTNETDSTISVINSGTYWVKTTLDGCVYTDYIQVNEMDCASIEMPNVFTPNNDGVNDFFFPIHMENVYETNLSILNRWGNVLYESTNPFKGWDGKTGGKECSAGTYYWVISYKNYQNKEKKLHGVLSLVR